MSTAPESAASYRVVQRNLVRHEQELDVRSLYVWAVTSMGGADPQAGQDEGRGKKEQSNFSSADVGLQGYGRITEDNTTVVEPSRRVTFGTYFNAFPAAYWRRWTDVDVVRLTLEVSGQGSIIVYRSTGKAHMLRAEAEHVDSADGPTTVTFDLPLNPFIDGGWYWFDIEGGEGEFSLHQAHWSVKTDHTQPGRVSIGITTFNRPDFAVDQLVAMASDSELLEQIDQVIMVDQGTQHVSDDPGFAAAAEKLGDKLNLILQPNLGGSGGFSRAMHETVQAGDSDYVLLLDDDVVCELEGIHRAVAFADLAKNPTLVGGHMFSLYDRTVMHAYGETLGRWRWFWGPAPSTIHGHDWSRVPLRSTKWLHRRIDVDYNGWWMCLIPTQVVKDIGLSLPMFIKWDDAEFGLRAGAAGYRTVSLPGVAVWHVPWTEKDDTIDWQAYFHERNRLISGLLHSPYPRGGRLVQESMENHVKRLMAMQYSAGELIMLAIEDVLAGPDRMHRDLRERLGEIRALRGEFDDARPRADLDFFPSPRLEKPRRKDKGVANPTRKRGKAMMAASGLVRQLSKPREFAAEHPEAIVPAIDQHWYRLAHFDSAVVSAADGVTAAWHRRDRSVFKKQLRRSAALHARLYKEWPKLREQYLEALPTLTSPEAWADSFFDSEQA